MHIAIFARQISNYHDARFRGASQAFSRVSVVSAANEGGFPELLASHTGHYTAVRLFPGAKAYGAAVTAGQMGAAVTAALTKLRPDAIAVAGWVSSESLAALSFARRRGLAGILMSESQGDDAPRNLARETVKRRLVRLADAALVGGPPHADYVATLGIDRDRIALGYNAVDNDHFAKGAAAARAEEGARARHGLPERYILASARFIAKKNLVALVRAYAAARATVPRAPDLVILGDGPERPAITHEIAEAGLQPHIHLPGFRGYDTLPAYYGLAEAFAHVSTVEQWGLVVNEAMAAGLPVVVSDRCGVARTVTGQASALITAPGEASITAALSRLFAMTPVERATMGKAAAIAIAEWGPDRFANGLAMAIEAARAAPRRGPIAPWDRLLVRLMERRLVERVA